MTASKGKRKAKRFKLVSTGKKQNGNPTGYFKTTTNSGTEKLKLRKFDPRAHNPKTGKRGMHVDFTQEKIK